MRRTRLAVILPVVTLGVLVSCSPAPQAGPHSSTVTNTDRGGPTQPSLATASTSTISATPSGPTPTAVRVRMLPWRLPEPVGREAAVVTSAGLVVAGGLVAGDTSTDRAYRLDLGSGRATPLPHLPVPVHDVGGALVHGRAEVVGGGNATEQDVVQAGQADGGWRVTSHLAQPRSDLVTVSVRDRVYAVGGYDGLTTALGDILVSADGGAFGVFGQLQVPVRYAAVARSAGALWVFGGERSGAEVDAIQRVDLGTGQVRVAAHLPRPLGHASAVAVGDRILLIGGRTDGSSLTAALWWFDPSTPGTLHRAGVLPTPLADSAVVVVGRSAYLIGGETPDLSDRVLELAFGG